MGSETNETAGRRDGITFCVTGATGYIGSWLVKTLLQRGYTVHATARDPEKASRILLKWGGDDQLKVFKADLQEEGSFDEAVKSCHGVFHVAASMNFNVSAKENLESYVQSHILDPAIKGTLNLLKSCLREKSIKRVVFTSSISTITAKDDQGKWKPTVNESCQTPVDHVWKTKACGWVYVLSKLVSEDAAFQFANKNGIDLVSVIPTTVAGPFLTPMVPASVRLLLSPITGESELNSILRAVHNRLGSISLVHIEDLSNAHIFLMEKAAAEGRYVCCTHSCVMPQLLKRLSLDYPYVNIESGSEDQPGSIPSDISSNKLKDLGFKYKYGFREIVQQSISCCLQHGFLNHSACNGSCH